MKKTTLLLATLFVGLILGLSSCKKDETVKNEDSPSGYLLGFRSAGDPSADYFLNTNTLSSGSISASGVGFELEGWNYYAKAGNTYFNMDYTNNLCTGYTVENGTLTELGQIAFDRMDCLFKGDNNNLVAIGAPWGGGSYDCQLQILNESVAITKNISHPIYTLYQDSLRLNAWPTCSYVQNGKLYVSFYPLNGVTWETPFTDTAYVSVFTYPGLEYQTTFKDTRTGPIGFYASQPAILEDENGNHYTISSSSIAAGFTQNTKPSGILKINSGESSFDPNYFFNVEDLGYKVMTGVYTGNGKVVARVISSSLDQSVPSWAAFSVMEAPICNIAVLDLNAQTITIVDDVPLHGGQYNTPFFQENGKVWMSITTDVSNAFLYAIDPSNATAAQGARIQGSEIQALFKY